MRIPFFQNVNQKEVNSTDDLGLSSSVSEADARVVNKDGTFNIQRRGQLIHIYFYLIRLSWPVFFAIILTFFTLINGTFALIYFALGVENIGMDPSGFWLMDLVHAFHFSVQTMTTVGYGVMHPISIPAGVVASFEALVGLLSFALATGLMFGRFSQPTQQIRFSRVAVVSDLNGYRSLQMRIANQYSHELMEVEAGLLVMLDREIDGTMQREFRRLKLELSRIQFMPLNWTLVHIIDEDSPIFELPAGDLKARHAEFLLSLKFYDESFARVMHTKTSYTHAEIMWDHRFLPAYEIEPDGTTRFDLDKLDEIEPVQPSTSSTIGNA